MNTIAFKRIHPDAVIPIVATEGSAGFDLTPIDGLNWVQAGGVWRAGTGLAVAIPRGWVGMIILRSSIARLGFVSNVGVIDSDYRGEMGLRLINTNTFAVQIPQGRLAQLVVVPCLTEAIEVDELTTTARGTGGFGSTGR